MTGESTTIAFDSPSLNTEGLAEICVSAAAGEAPKGKQSLLGQLRQGWCSDDELALQLQDGNADALSILFKRHSSLIYAIAQRILGNAAEAEDAVQQVFLDVFRSIGQFKPEKGDFKTWLLMFAYHRTFNIRRGLRASRFFDTDSLDEALPDFLAQAKPPHALSSAEMRVLVGQVLQTIPPRQRRAIELVYYGGLTAREVSTRTGETVRVVRHNLYRGLEKLRKTLCLHSAGAKVNGKGGSL